MSHSGKTMTFAIDLVPQEDNIYNLGNSSQRWKIYGDVQPYTTRIYPVLSTTGERSAWYKITFPYYNATTGSAAKWFMNSFDLHFGGGYNANPSGVAHISFYWTRAANNGAWTLGQGAAYIEGILANKITFYYRVAEPGILYVSNTANAYNGIWLDNLYVDDTSPSLDWSTTKIEATSAITANTDPALSAYTILSTTYLYNSGGTLKTDSNFEGKYIKGTWLYTSAATAKTSTSKLATIESDNFIYYITPANALKSAVGTTTIGGASTPIYWDGSAFTAGTALSDGAYKSILNNTSAGALGWNSAGNTNANNLRLINVNTLAYWNGAYSGTSSNLTYYKGGAFGTMAKENATDYAKLASPTFTGTPKAPTAANGTSTTQIATTEFVNNTLAYANAMTFKGTLGTGGTITTLPASHNAGDTYRVITAGTWAGKYCEVGTLIICTTDGTAANDAHWTSVETNEDGAVIGPSSSTTNSLAFFNSTTGRVIDSTSKITVYNDVDITVQGATKKRNGIRLSGTCYGNTAADLTSNTAGVMRYEDGGVRIEFSADSSDNAALLYTNHDYANTGGGSSFHFVGQNGSNDTGGNLAVTAPDFVARRRMAVGQNFTDTNYALKVKGTSLFTGNFEVRGNTIRLRNANNDNNQAGTAPYVTSLLMGDGSYVAFNEFHDDWLAIQSRGLVLNVRSSPIAVYDTTKTYAVGDVVWYDKNYYICNTAITTAEAWTAGHWSLRNPSGAILSEGSIIPWTNNTYTLGNSSYKWSTVYATTFSGNATSANYINLYEARGTTTTLNKAANYVAAGAMFHLVASSNTSATDNGKTPTDANILQMNWDNSGGYDAQLGIATGINRMYFRARPSSKTAWDEVAHAPVGTTGVGNSTQPVYMTSEGVITACTSYANASVNYATSAGSATSATTATYIKCTDTRNTALNPTDLTAAQGVRFDFKAKGTINLTATDTYAGVMSFRPYASNTDWSGGNAHQLAFNSEGLHWRNGGASWGNWYQILDSNNTSAAKANGTAVSVTCGTDATLATINNVAVKINVAKPTYTYSDVGAAATNHGTHVTTATVQSALGINSSGSSSKALTEKGTFVTFGTSNLTIGTTSGTAMAGNTTVTNVAISANITTDADYPIVFATSNKDTTAAKNEGLQKSGAKFYFNPNTGNVQATTFNGYTLAAASAKGVVTTIDTSANLPTSNAVKTFVEGKGYTTNTGTVTSVKLIQGAGITVSSSGTAITTTGERTISITGMDTTNGSTTKWLNQKGGWSTPTAANVGALASSTVVTNVAISANTVTNADYPIVFATSNTGTTAAKNEGLQKSGAKLFVNPSTGTLYSTKFCVNESVTLQYNTTDQSLEFIF